MIGINRNSSSTGMHPSYTSNQDTPETDISTSSNGNDNNDKAFTTPVKGTLSVNDDNSNNNPAESDTTTLPEMPALDPLSSPINETTAPTSPKNSAASTPSTPTAETNQDAVTTVDGKPDVALTEAMTDESVNATAKPVAAVASNGQPVLQRSSSSQHQGSMSKNVLGVACCKKTPREQSRGTTD